MRLWSVTRVPFSLRLKIPLQTTHQVTKKSGAVPMKSILSAMACQAMNWMIGTGPNVNSKRSLFFKRGWNRLQQQRHPDSGDGN